MAWRSCSAVSHASIGTTYPPTAPVTPAVSVSHGRQQGERHEVPRAAVDAAVGEDLAVVGELQLAAHEPVGELAGLDGERADVAGDLLVVLASRPRAEDDLEHALPGLAGGQ